MSRKEESNDFEVSYTYKYKCDNQLFERSPTIGNRDVIDNDFCMNIKLS